MRPCALLLAASLLHASSSFSWAQSAPENRAIVPARVTVPAGRMTYWPVKIGYVKDGRIAGNAMAAGGAGNDIRVLILTEPQLRAMTAGQRLAQPFYDSGKRRSVVLSVPVSEPGTYYVVFDNTFSMVSPKDVSTDLRLLHRGADTERVQELRRQATEREQRIGAILGKMVRVLQAKERELGTRQIQTPIYIAVSRDTAPNAYAAWQRRIVGVTAGTMALVESLPQEDGDNLLAGVLGHELAHIFYRHSSGNAQLEQRDAAVAGAAGALMIHPVVGIAVGVLAMDTQKAYDRMEETEADKLGIRLACAAGYDPNGAVVFHRILEQRGLANGGFLKTHPRTHDRVVSLSADAQGLRCPQR